MSEIKVVPVAHHKCKFCSMYNPSCPQDNYSTESGVCREFEDKVKGEQFSCFLIGRYYKPDQS